MATVKIRNSNDLKFYTYHTDVDKVGRYDELTEEQRIAEGTRPPYYVTPDFSKTKEEKEELSRMKRSAIKHDSPGLFEVKPSFPYRATVHLYNRRGEKDFKTTHSINIPKEYLNKWVMDNFGTIFVKRTNSYRTLPIDKVVRKMVYNGVTVVDNGEKKSSTG